MTLKIITEASIELSQEDIRTALASYCAELFPAGLPQPGPEDVTITFIPPTETADATIRAVVKTIGEDIP